MSKLRTARRSAGQKTRDFANFSEARTLGEKACAEQSLNFADVFSQQFRMTPQGAPALPGFHVTNIGQWQMQSGPDLALSQVQFNNARGHLIFLGIGVDDDGDVITSRRLRHKIKTFETLEAVERFVTSCAGRYAAVIVHGAQMRFHLDPLGSLGAVYDAQTRTVASTLNLALTRDVQPNTDYPLTDLANSGASRFAFGHTSDQHVKRVLPNHYLDLHNFNLTRHYNGADDIFDPSEDEQRYLLRKISHRLEKVIGALSRHSKPAILPLSGGVDSRVLLASSKAAFGNLQIFSHATNMISRKDVRIAKRLCGYIGQPMTAIDPRREERYRITDPDQFVNMAKIWEIATDTPSPKQDQHEIVHAYPKGGLLLRGNGADFLKAVLWRRAVAEYAEDRPHSIDEGLRMMMLGDSSITDNDFLRAAYSDWYSTFTGEAAKRPYDFMFAEQFLSHGQGNLFYGMTNNFYICPFNDRSLLSMATSLPPDRRRDLDYVQALVNWRAPEISQMHYTRKAVNLLMQSKRLAEAPVMQVA